MLERLCILAASLPSFVCCSGSISGDIFVVSLIPPNLLQLLQSTAPSGTWLFQLCLAEADCSVSTACAGSISGDNFDAPFIPHDLLRPLQSTAPSGVWLFPDPVLWGDKVLVETNGSKYRAKDALQMLQDLGLTQQVCPHVGRLLAVQRAVHGGS